MSNSYMPPPPSAAGAPPLADPRAGAGWDDPRHDLPSGKPQSLLGNIAAIAAVVGVVLVWALQDSLYVIGFTLGGAAIVLGVVAVFSRRNRRTAAIAAIVIGAMPFLFTALRLVVGF
ncbi:hypothetical protein BH11ACT3_BH11ACT3_18930 [soil metagenome]